MKKGTYLHCKDIEYVKRTYVHRYTGDHIPQWVSSCWDIDSIDTPLQFKDDQEWLMFTEFHVKKDGTLDMRFSNCISSPTWPNNPELREKYREMTEDNELNGLQDIGWKRN